MSSFKVVARDRKVVLIEIFLQIAFVGLILVQVLSTSIYAKYLTNLYNIFLIRNFRLIRYLKEVQDVFLLFRTFVFLTKPILTKFFFVYLVFYEYAYFGQLIFGGTLTFTTYASVAPAPFYYLMNFNDFASALVVLFQQMVVNNWWVVVNMLVALQP